MSHQTEWEKISGILMKNTRSMDKIAGWHEIDFSAAARELNELLVTLKVQEYDKGYQSATSVAEAFTKEAVKKERTRIVEILEGMKKKKYVVPQHATWGNRKEKIPNSMRKAYESSPISVGYNQALDEALLAINVQDNE